MLISRKDIFISLLLFCAGFLVLAFLVPEWLFSPNDLLMSDFGDGFKNTFAFAWFLEHESSGILVNGVNYPYGEHLVYLDGQPGLALLLRPLGLGDFAVGFAAWSLAVSFASAGVFLYLVGRELGMQRGVAVLMGLSLILLSPQLERLTNHTTLAYISCLPGAWFWLLLTVRMDRKWIGVGIILVHNLFWTLIHPYLGLMVGMFMGGFWVLWLLRQGLSLRLKWQWILYGGLIAFLHLALFRGWLMATDIHSGRPSLPAGFLHQLASEYSLLFPRFGPIADFWDGHLKTREHLTYENWEGFGYLGLAQIGFGFLGLIGAVVAGVRNRFRGWFQDDRKMLMGISMVAAVAMLLFSMGYPFKSDPVWMERLDFLRQFRFLGRFNWMFFYVFGVFAWVWIDRFAERLRDGISRWNAGKGSVVGTRLGGFLAAVLLFGVMGLNLVEGHFWVRELNKSLFISPNPFVRRNVDQGQWKLGGALENIYPREFQSLLPVPFWYTGTETLQLPRVQKSRSNGMILAHHTGLPLHAIDGARAPVWQGKQQCQLFAPTHIKKELEKEIDDPRSVLVVHTKELNLCPEEEDFLSRGVVFYEDEGLRLLSYSRDQLFTYTPVDWRAEVDSLIFYQGYEDMPCDRTYRGEGAFSDWIGRFSVLFDSERDSVQLEAGKEYEFSFWFRHVEDGIYRHGVIMEQFNAAGENVGYDVRDEGKNSRTFDGEWVQMVYRFEVKEEAEIVRWFLNGDHDLNLEIFIDGVMIREL